MQNEWMNRKDIRYLYVLACEEGHYYVGQTSKPVERIGRHFKGKGSAWTRMYPPLEVIFLAKTKELNYRDGEMLENQLVVNFMLKYGKEFVRGGFFANTDEENHAKNIRHHLELGTIEWRTYDLSHLEVFPNPNQYVVGGQIELF